MFHKHPVFKIGLTVGTLATAIMVINQMDVLIVASFTAVCNILWIWEP